AVREAAAAVLRAGAEVRLAALGPRHVLFDLPAYQFDGEALWHGRTRPEVPLEHLSWRVANVEGQFVRASSSVARLDAVPCAVAPHVAAQLEAHRAALAELEKEAARHVLAFLGALPAPLDAAAVAEAVHTRHRKLVRH